MSDKSNFSELYSDVLRYIGKKMKDSERIKFEKELEADAFSKDAVEGLSKLEVDDIERDIASFSFIRPRKIQYQKAAIVLFIIAILALLIFVFLRKDEKDKDDNIENEVTETLSSLEGEQKNVTDSLEYDSTAVTFVDSVETIMGDTITKESIIADTTTKIAPEIENNEEQVEPKQEVKDKVEPVSDVVDKTDNQPSSEEKADNQLSPEDEIDDQPSPVEEKEEITENENIDEGDSDENEQPENKEQPKNEITNVPDKPSNDELKESDFNPMHEDGDIITEKATSAKGEAEESAAEEVIVDQDNEEEQEAVTENNSTGESYINQIERRPGVNAEPKPLGGQALFDEYIENNLRYPLTGKGREVVKIEFTVTLTGELTDFKVLRSPDDKAFEREAIRLLSEGPKWSPAIEDGIPVKDSESVRIVFRP